MVTAGATDKASGLLSPCLPVQGFVQKHLDVGLVANTLLAAIASANIGGLRARRDRACLRAGRGLRQGKCGSG